MWELLRYDLPFHKKNPSFHEQIWLLQGSACEETAEFAFKNSTPKTAIPVPYHPFFSSLPWDLLFKHPHPDPQKGPWHSPRYLLGENPLPLGGVWCRKFSHLPVPWNEAGEFTPENGWRGNTLLVESTLWWLKTYPYPETNSQSIWKWRGWKMDPFGMALFQGLLLLVLENGWLEDECFLSFWDRLFSGAFHGC